MKTSFIALALVLSPFAAGAQVIVNQAALDQLAGIPPAVITAPPEIRQPPHKVAYRPVVHKHIVAPPEATTTLASSRIAPVPAAPKPVLPAAPVTPVPPQPQPVVAKPVIPKPVAPPPTAAVTFASGVSDLPPGINAQLKPFCAKNQAGSITIDAYAAADPSDPSAAPRLSMARAFALRDALVACGVPSANIIPRADGTGKNPNVAQISTAP